MVLNREQFNNLPDLPMETVEAGPWGKINVRALDALELIDLMTDITSIDKSTDERKANYEASAKIACRCMIDDQHNRMFQDDEYRLLFGKHGVEIALPIIVATANRLSRIFPEDAPGKNSEPNETGDLPSD